MPTLVHGDPMRLRQILVNLVGNAIKFTHQREVYIEVRQATSADLIPGTICLYTRVRDTGIGIPPGSQAHIFDSFAQADGSTTRKHGGTGLGLTIAKQLVEMMDGMIGVDSASGVGSTFWFTAQLYRQDMMATHAPQPYVNPDAANAGVAVTPACAGGNVDALSILIVDDNLTSRQVLASALVAWGASYESAESGDEALELLCQRTIDGEPHTAAIIDLEMPDMDGLSLAQAIRALPAFAEMQLILLTPVGQGDLQEEDRSGFSTVLTKPVRRADLYRALEAMIETPDAGHMVSREAHTHEMTTASYHRILLVEDNPINQEVGLGMLETLGYQADVAEDGRQALDVFVRARYDLVLMDCQMPHMDGFEATGAIRAQEGADSHTPIIAMIANAMEGDRKQCLAAGMDDYLSKPFSLDMLQDMLAKWLTAMPS